MNDAKPERPVHLLVWLVVVGLVMVSIAAVLVTDSVIGFQHRQRDAAECNALVNAGLTETLLEFAVLLQTPPAPNDARTAAVNKVIVAANRAKRRASGCAGRKPPVPVPTLPLPR